MIALDRATVIRGEAVVLDQLSLRIRLGQHSVLLGPNGCGKSTFIKLINRELYPLAREGETPVRVLGMQRWRITDLRSQLGLVSGDLGQRLQEMHQLSAREAVLSGFFASFVIPPDATIDPAMEAQAQVALERVQAGHLAPRLLAELSTGEARRVLIARALVHQPLALLLDEPTAGLDVVAQQQFLALLSELAGQGITLVLVTHHLEEIIPAFERIILLQQGKLLADGTPARVLTSELLSHAYGGEVRVCREDGRYRAVAAAWPSESSHHP
ncbi:ABC transporter ATP-binding protein [Pseudoxanthomonas dokdonensis]|uniref:ABC transporter ATP-binding protein n=1 Tax=Pseudoxanthomonas dokdonensis TaxID=344882 RepID=A0A0R0CU26_9GAMM|nr:ATP-binding cassette domain-containing protein [Pseudoxanthomonas dokdonensis]KRG68392.1 ABC transporter ATP-binding protein [Pseudoxanthomonas dokdonensis]